MSLCIISPPLIAGALFDLDGTLTESEKLLYKAWVELARRYGCDFSTFDYADIIGRPDLDCCRIVSDRFGLGKDPQRFHEEYKVILRVLDDELTMRPGADALLEHLKGLDVPMALVTSADAELAWFALNRFGFGKYFTAVVTAETEGLAARKPDPSPYLLGARLLGVDPSRCIAFEDSPAGVKAARGAGCFVFGCPHEHSPAALLGEAHVSLEELSGFHTGLVRR